MEEKIFTSKQRNFFKYIALGFTRAEAARKAHYKAPRASAMENIRNHTQAFREAFAQAGYSIANIVEDVIDGTKAMRTISATVIVKPDDPTVKQQQANARTMDFIDVPDWNARHKFIDTTIDLQDLYPPRKHEIGGKDGEPMKIEAVIVERASK